MAPFYLQRKQRRKWSGRSLCGRAERPVIQGLWVQEVDWLKSGEPSSDVIPPPPQFTDFVLPPCGTAGDADCSCTDVCECVTGQSGDTDDCDLDQDSESESDSSRGAEDDPPETTNLTFDLMQVSSASDARSSGSAGSLQSLLGDSHSNSSDVNKSQCVFGLDELNLPDAVVDVLRGRVTQMTKASASPVFRNLIQQTLREWRSCKHLHEGLIFHHVRHRNAIDRQPQLNCSSHFTTFSLIPCLILKQLQPSRCQYREGEEYCILHHIQNGAYGDIFCVRDAATGFTCAAKKVRQAAH